MSPPRPWLQILATRSLWWRAVRIAVPVGLVQVMINQGDHLLHGELTTPVVAKSLLTPTVTFLVAFASAAITARSTQSTTR